MRIFDDSQLEYLELDEQPLEELPLTLTPTIYWEEPDSEPAVIRGWRF